MSAFCLDESVMLPQPGDSDSYNQKTRDEVVALIVQENKKVVLLIENIFLRSIDDYLII